MTGPDPRFDADPDEPSAEAARARRRRREEHDLATTESTLAGVLTGLAAAGTPVTLTTVTGARRRGRVRGVGDGVVSVHSPDRRWWVRLSSVAWIGPDGPLRVDVAGAVDGGVTLEKVVAGLAGTREMATFTMIGGSVVSGEVAWCGAEVAGVVAEDPGRPIVVYLASVSEVSLAAPSAESL